MRILFKDSGNDSSRDNFGGDNFGRDDFGGDNLMLYLYGDPAYSLSYGVIGPYSSRSSGGLTAAQLATNMQMSSARIVVEWAFGLVLSYGEKKDHNK